MNKRNSTSSKANDQLNPDAWERRFFTYLFNRAFRMTNDRELAKDLVQETFLAGLEQASSFANNSSEKTWLTSILNYKIYKVYRSRNRKLILFSASYDEPVIYTDEKHQTLLPIPVKDFYQVDPVEEKEFRSLLCQCIRNLPEQWQSVLVLKYVLETPSKDICRQLNISQSNFCVICHRTRLKLKSNLAHYPEY